MKYGIVELQPLNVTQQVNAIDADCAWNNYAGAIARKVNDLDEAVAVLVACALEGVLAFDEVVGAVTGVQGRVCIRRSGLNYVAIDAQLARI